MQVHVCLDEDIGEQRKEDRDCEARYDDARVTDYEPEVRQRRVDSQLRVQSRVQIRSPKMGSPGSPAVFPLHEPVQPYSIALLLLQ